MIGLRQVVWAALICFHGEWAANLNDLSLKDLHGCDKLCLMKDIIEWRAVYNASDNLGLFYSFDIFDGVRQFDFMTICVTYNERLSWNYSALLEICDGCCFPCSPSFANLANEIVPAMEGAKRGSDIDACGRGLAGINEIQCKVHLYRLATLIAGNCRRSDPRSLLTFKQFKLAAKGIGLPLCLSSQSAEVGYGSLQISGINGVQISEIRNDQSADCDKERASRDPERQPLIDRTAREKVTGWSLAALAVWVSTIGCVCLWISLSGMIFGLTRRARILTAASGLTCGGLAFWVLDQLAAPLLR